VGWLAIAGGLLILAGIPLNLLLYLSFWARVGIPLDPRQIANFAICIGAANGVLGTAAVVKGIMALRGRLQRGSGLILLGVLTLPVSLFLFGGLTGIAGALVLIVGGILAERNAYSSVR
jgi:CDP-diglyceride synthetase